MFSPAVLEEQLLALTNPLGMRDAWCKANLALSSPALSVDFHVSALSVVQVLSFSLADIYGAGVGTGVRVTGVAVREGLPNWALTNADLPVDLAGIGRGVFLEVGQVGVARDRGIERFCMPSVVKKVSCRVPQQERQGL